VKILLRADSGFARDGSGARTTGSATSSALARNQRLVGQIAAELAAVEAESLSSGRPARRFVDFARTTRESWSRELRAVAGAEHLPKGANPRFVVTSPAAGAVDARTLYDDVYCTRGRVENRIKEQQLDPFADRTPAANPGRVARKAFERTARSSRAVGAPTSSTSGSRPSPTCSSKRAIAF
jgi:hypothetical protein